MSGRTRLTFSVAAAVAVCSIVYAVLPREPVLRATFLDVGEGLCVVLRTPSAKTVVVDCGTSSWREPEAVGEKVAARYLQSIGVDEIDVAVMTHPHADHISGFGRLAAQKRVRMIVDSGCEERPGWYSRLVSRLKRNGTVYRMAQRGQTVDMRDGVVLQVLNSAADRSADETNDESTVVRVLYGRVALMLTSDAGGEAEQGVLASRQPVRSQILQVGHHGSESATSAAWLHAVSPKIAIISCGRGNEHGHPSKAVIGRLKACGARICRTDEDGAVEAITNGRWSRVRTFRNAR